uniref:Ubiquitin carboxyl-terminal hydrolase 36 n=1 Tax=Henneguya salminicola TaxID=69463 RepID=A0A6G3MEU0_HENSL
MASSVLALNATKKIFSLFSSNADLSTQQSDSEIEFVGQEQPDKYIEEILNEYNPLNKSSFHGASTNRKKSEEIQKIPAPKVQLFSPNELLYEWNCRRMIGPGFINPHNTCFMNSVLQILSYTPPLWQYLLKQDRTKCKSGGFCTFCALAQLFKDMNSSNKTAILPKSIINNIGLIGSHLNIGTQEDAHEFLISTMSSLKKHFDFNESQLDRYSKESHFINHIFGGWIRSTGN